MPAVTTTRSYRRRPLLLNGFMATGKSTIARELSARTGHPFVDLDALVEARAGLSVAEIFAQRGEPEFRRLEREVLFELLTRWRDSFALPPVVALGGGALLHRPTRLEALERAVVVTLTASAQVIASRAGSSGQRPLLAGPEPAARIRELLEQRAVAYQECHGSVANDGAPTASVVSRVGELWERDAIAVAASEHSYVVEVGRALVAQRLSELASGGSGAVLVTDRTVGPLYGEPVRRALEGAGLATAEVVLEPGEQHKNLSTLEQIFAAAFDRALDRKGLFVGLGGGVVTDMTGFAAATWVRGVRWLGLPTTLLAMVDASVGGKTAVDFKAAKNSVGAFWQPSGVLCDIDTLKTETDRAFVGALAEVVKTALIGDAELYALLEREAESIVKRDPSLVAEIVERSVRVKAAVVARDERESGLRATLNLGHTIGHALEAHGQYATHTHGEAVSLGLVAALKIGERLGRTPAELAERTTQLLARLRLPTGIEREPVAAAAQLIAHDKKRAGSSVRFVVAEDIGRVTTLPLDLGELVEHASVLGAR